MYNNASRVWHAKSKHKATAVGAYDLDGDGVPELIAGWASGKIEARNERTGELVYRDKFPSAITAVLSADLRMEDREQLVVCSQEGEVRGYVPADEELKGQLMDVSSQENTLKALYDKKQELMNELKSYDSNLKQIKAGRLAAGIVPPTTKLNVIVKPNKTFGAVVITLTTNNDTVIKLAMVFSEVLFEEESLVIHPAKPSGQLIIPIKVDKNISTDLQIKAVVGYKGGLQDHVFELAHTLPKFAAFAPVKVQEIASGISFSTTERGNRIVLWLQQAFPTDEKLNPSLHEGFCYQSVRDGTYVLIRVGGDSQVQIRSESMELVGDVLQELCRYLKITNLETVADFPKEMAAFEQVLARVDEHQTIRQRLSAEIADTSNAVKQLVIKAEDARLLNDMATMTQHYTDLFNLNRELIGEYTKRTNNHAELLKALKDVKHMIHKASRLRMGAAMNRVIELCRKAIGSNATSSLNDIIRFGTAGVSSAALLSGATAAPASP